MAVVRLSAIGFHKNQKHPFLIHFEEMFFFALIAKLNQSGEITVKDMVAGNHGSGNGITDTLAGLAPIKLYQELHRLARQTQTRYVLYGALDNNEPSVSEHLPVESMSIALHLFDHQDNLMAWEKSIAFDHFLTSSSAGASRLVMDIAPFNQLLAQVLEPILALLLPETPEADRNLIARTPICHSHQALLHLMQAQKKPLPAERIHLLNQAVQEDAEFELAYAQLAKTYRLERVYDQSVLHYRKAFEACKSGPHIQAQYATDAGIASALMSRNDLALQWWERAISLWPTYVNPYFNIANLYEDANEYDKAAFYFEKAQAVAPNDYRTFYNLARVYAKLNAWDKALIQYQYQLSDDDKDAWCHSDIATCYLNLGDIDRAKAHLEKTVALDDHLGEASEYAKLILANLAL